MGESNLIHIDLSPSFRGAFAALIKTRGVQFAIGAYVTAGFHPSFIRALARSVMGKEGW